MARNSEHQRDEDDPIITIDTRGDVGVNLRGVTIDTRGDVGVNLGGGPTIDTNGDLGVELG